MDDDTQSSIDAALVPMRTVKQQVLGLELLRELAEIGQRVFTMVDIQPIAKEIGLEGRELESAVELLRTEGWITRIRRGVYAIVSAIPPIDPAHNFEIAMSLSDPAIISHWSALHYHGLVSSLPDVTYVTTETGVAIPRMNKTSDGSSYPVYEVQDRKFRFVQMKQDRIFGLSTRFIHDCKVKITNPERSLIDGLMSPHYCGGMPTVLSAFTIRGRELNLRRIIDYAQRTDAATMKRLGWFLERQQWSLRALEPLLDCKIKGFRKLDPQGSQEGSFNRRWMIRENLPLR